VMRRTPYRAHRTSKARLMLRGSIGWPVRVVNTSACFSPHMQVFGQSAARAWSWLRFAIRSAVTQIGGSGSVSVLPSTLRTCLWVSGCPPTRCSCHSRSMTATSSSVHQSSSGLIQSESFALPQAGTSRSNARTDAPRPRQPAEPPSSRRTFSRRAKITGKVVRPRYAPGAPPCL